MPEGKQSINGTPITREEAIKGLGNPKNWDKLKKKVNKEFRKKPKKN